MKSGFTKASLITSTGAAMDTNPLVTEEIDAGAELIRRFQEYMPVETAFWLNPSVFSLSKFCPCCLVAQVVAEKVAQLCFCATACKTHHPPSQCIAELWLLAFWIALAR